MKENNVGRPSKYKEEYCEQMINFFNVPYMINEEETYTDKDGYVKTRMKKVPNYLPTLQRFAFQIGVHIDTLHEWKKNHVKFSEAYDMCKQLTEDLIVNLALRGAYKENFAKFYVQNITTLRDKSEQVITSNVQKEIIYIDQTEKQEIENHIKEVVGE